MECPKVAIFDLDGTLSAAFTPPDEAMMHFLIDLTKRAQLAIMSAATFERIEREILSRLGPEADIHVPYVFSLNGAQCRMHHNGEWVSQYDFAFHENDVTTIKRALEAVAREAPILREIVPEGSQVIDYRGYLAFTALGVEASDEAKHAWDPDASKRLQLITEIQKELPQYDVYIGGRTTIDITPKGRNKGYAVQWLADYLKTPTSDLLFVGDGLGEGGNDAVVIPTGIKTISVKGPEETKLVIAELLAACAA